MATVLPNIRTPMKHRLTVDEYYRMGEAGILKPDQRVELLDGEIYDMNAIGSLHASTVREISLQFAKAAIDGQIIASVQDPLRLDDDTEPVPDFMALLPRPDAYGDSHPQGRDVLLLVEVAHASLEHDKRKLPRYAQSGVCEVWIADIDSRSVLVYRDPQAARYHDTDTRTEGLLHPLRLPDIPIDIHTLFGPRT